MAEGGGAGGGDGRHTAAAGVVQGSRGAHGRQSGIDRIVPGAVAHPGLPGQCTFAAPFSHKSFAAAAPRRRRSSSGRSFPRSTPGLTSTSTSDRAAISACAHRARRAARRRRCVPSGPHTHGTDLSAPIQQQPGALRQVRIGAGSWIGSNAVVLADVGCDTIVGAGAVVTRPLPDRVIAAGVPARIVKRRDEPASVPA